MADIFGDRALFAEFERDRTTETTFISYNTDTLGAEDRSQIVFTLGGDDSDSSSVDEHDKEPTKQENENETASALSKNNLSSQKEWNTSEADSGNEQNSPFMDEDTTGDCATTEQSRKTTFQLQHELKKYRRFARLVDSTRHVPDEQSPAVQIIFQNNRFSRKYRTHIEQFIKSLIANDYLERYRVLELPLKADTLTAVDVNDQLTSNQRTMQMWKNHCIIGCSQFHDYFLIDTLGWPLIDFNPTLTEGWSIPLYEQIFLDVLPVDEKEIEEAAKKKFRPTSQKPKSACWNCGGNHSIAQCQAPKNHNKIRENMNNFKAKRSPATAKKSGGSRYHGDIRDDPRFGHFKPGKYSAELQVALGIISEKELPYFIYKMREHGYPPGWFAEAQESASGIVMFDKHGKETNLDGDTMEDGEIGPDTQEPSLKLDRIIEYPGFTVPAAEGVRDDSRRFNLPGLQNHQLKDVLKAQMTEKRKREEEDGEESLKKRARVENKESDMDLDNDDEETAANYSLNDSFRPPLPINTPPCMPPLPRGTPPSTPRSFVSTPPIPEKSPFRPPLPDGTPPPTPECLTRKANLGESLDQSNLGRNSPSLEDLEKEYSLIQQKLLESDGQDSSYFVVDSCGEESDTQLTPSRLTPTVPEGKMSRQGSLSSIQSFGELGQGVDISSSQNSPAADTTKNFISFGPSKSLSKDYGTPILSKQEDLPSFEKFGKGVEDHLLFENLPDSVGTYSKMRTLFSKIREKVNLRKKKKKS